MPLRAIRGTAPIPCVTQVTAAGRASGRRRGGLAAAVACAARLVTTSRTRAAAPGRCARPVAGAAPGARGVPRRTGPISGFRARAARPSTRRPRRRCPTRPVVRPPGTLAVGARRRRPRTTLRSGRCLVRAASGPRAGRTGVRTIVAASGRASPTVVLAPGLAAVTPGPLAAPISARRRPCCAPRCAGAARRRGSLARGSGTSASIVVCSRRLIGTGSVRRPGSAALPRRGAVTGPITCSCVVPTWSR